MEGLKKRLSEPSSREREREMTKLLNLQVTSSDRHYRSVVASSSNQAIRTTRFLLFRGKIIIKKRFNL